ncbi:lipase secreted protein [Asticcacaulis biprosthecium C19]|uniref:Lipase secreted protein n=1 Tax=Asticcacaulis biprosthecium C19 TaxID=715226 RepID=F4QMD6_9CAUL|nr:lipase secreted protein [Asticcacaulis biprosthecium C19]
MPGAGAVILFYPADGAPSATTYPAAAMSSGHAAQLTRRFGAPVAQALAVAPGHAIPDAALANGDWPLLVFAPGWYLSGQDYRVLCQHVASQGFRVAVLSDLPDAGAHPPYARTAEAILSVVAGIGTTNAPIGVFGHSVGGAAAVLAASRNPAIRAVVNLDGDYAADALMARPKQPLLHVRSVTPGEPANSVARRDRDWQAVSQASSSPQLLTLSDFRHLNVLDAALLASSVPQDRRHKAFGAVDGAQGLAITARLVTGFFDEYLKGQAGAYSAANL